MYKQPNGRLTEAGVRRIHELRAQKKTLQAIAAELGLSLGTIHNVAKGKTHAHLHPTVAPKPLA